MRKASKYGDLEVNSSEYNRAQYICTRYKITYEEYVNSGDKYPRLTKGRVKHKCGTKEYKRAYYFLLHYGLTEVDLEELLVTQDYKCAICKKEVNVIDCHVDHCHITKEVRGILCRMCNLGLGHFFDNKESLKSAIIYLEDSE